MQDLVAATVFFLGIHLGIAGTRVRDAIVARTGEKVFRISFAALSIAGLVWLIRAYSRAPVVAVWSPPSWMIYVTIALAFVGAMYVVIGLLTPTPTTVNRGKLLESPDVVRGVVRITRHPFLWGVALWALGHLLVNGDAASMLVFGMFLVLAIIGTVSIDAKRRRRYGDKWDRFAAATSNVPFAAIASGRNRFSLGEIGLWRIAVAIAVLATTLYLHAAVFGGAPLRAFTP
jgi:uncharacterized membrane protein